MEVYKHLQLADASAWWGRSMLKSFGQLLDSLK